MSIRWLNIFAVSLVLCAGALLVYGNYNFDKSPRLLNVSYDPTRELYATLNPKFLQAYGRSLQIEQSHGGSSKQARAVAEGLLAADVVTLALPSDIEGLVRKGLVAKDWQQRLPHHAQPYSSTIVFVVRKTNPKSIRDWPDLIGPGVMVVTPDPRTSGNGKLSVLAAWGAVVSRGGSEDEAREFLRRLYQHVAGLGQGARDATTTFALAKEGDVHLTWENEAIREAQQSSGELEVVYPPVSIRAEPSVAWVDANVDKHGSAAAAKVYLEYLFSDEAQELLAKDGYRPSNEAILHRHRDLLPDVQLFPVTLIAKDWDDAQSKFFGDNGIFSLIRPTKAP